ncbi:peptidase inhibitor family I36 protein [Streptomyces rubrogriseus]|uniref:peptidase inhibitor family I36 protein n=1 Tax=Streptomyces rubrogriseus TaxID=194673 RepID=UPI00380E1149
MRLAHTRLAAALTTAVILGGLALPATASAAPQAWACNEGSFCVYSGDNGTGSVCGWSGDDPDWRNGTSVCSWAGGTRVQSAYNNGLSGAPVSAYTAINYGGTKMFCLAKGERGNLAGVGTYLRSHTWSC